MTHSKKKALGWLSAGLLLSLGLVLVVFTGLTGHVVVTDPEGIPEAANMVMASIQSGDWDTLEAIVAGDSALEPLTGEDNTAQQFIWNTYLQSIRWDCRQSFETNRQYVQQPVKVTCLDIPAVTAGMAELLPENADPSALRAAAEQVLNEEIPTTEHTITLSFQRRNGQWQMIPDSALLALLSGFTAH